jgi:hypothetical protein
MTAQTHTIPTQVTPSSLPTLAFLSRSCTLPTTRSKCIPFVFNHFCTLLRKHRGCHQERFSAFTDFIIVTDHGTRSTDHISLTPVGCNTYNRSPRFAVFWPKSSAPNPFGCNTCRNQRRNSFRRNTYKKPRVEALC